MIQLIRLFSALSSLQIKRCLFLDKLSCYCMIRERETEFFVQKKWSYDWVDLIARKRQCSSNLNEYTTDDRVWLIMSILYWSQVFICSHIFACQHINWCMIVQYETMTIASLYCRDLERLKHRTDEKTNIYNELLSDHIYIWSVVTPLMNVIECSLYNLSVNFLIMFEYYHDCFNFQGE